MFQRKLKHAMIALAGAAMLAACAKEEASVTAWPAPTLDGKAPIVIAHRGASGYRPEHTLEGYGLAIEMGADVIEPDLVFSKDEVLIVRHDRYLSGSTDVADHPEFADRKRANDDASDEPRKDWWVEDFTLAELKTLRARQAFPGRSKEYDGLYEIPTFAEVLAFVSGEAKKAGRPIGVYPETKHPGFFAAKGYDFEAPLLDALKGFSAGPVFIQSFEPEILTRLKGKTDAKLIQLVFEASPGAGSNVPLEYIATYADGVGPAKELLLNDDGSDRGFVREAHEKHLAVHPWTFRKDLARSFTGAPEHAAKMSAEDGAIDIELRATYKLGVDGVFTDFPDIAVRVRSDIEKGVVR